MPAPRRFSSAPARAPPPARALACARVLARLLALVDWPDFLALANTCRAHRALIHRPALKDAILARFVPGYAPALRDRDPARFEDVPVALHDIALLLAAQRAPLHRYPAHALALMNALFPTPEQERLAHQLAALASAHSRFVLLLQSLVHSSSAPLEPEPDELVSLPPLRELVFPAPLHQDKPPPAPVSPPSPGPSKRRFSFLAKRASTPPPPREPPALAYSSWRQTVHYSTLHESASSEFGTLPRPRRRFASTDVSSSSSSLSRSPPSTPSSPPSDASPHDLAFATVRTRAPVLRVFVPCAALVPSIPACAAQLARAGLWPHLSAGDLVCNLGCVPPAAPGPPPPAWLVFTGTALAPFAPPAPAPLADALALPSPRYFAHVAPAADPAFVLRVPRAPPPRLALLAVPAPVPSPHSPAGAARARRFAWTARVRVRAGPAVGSGWAAEWVLEGAGTREGRAALLARLAPAAPPAAWALVRERCAPGRLWLRLLDAPADA